MKMKMMNTADPTFCAMYNALLCLLMYADPGIPESGKS